MSSANYEFKPYFRRWLPHIHSWDKPIFITWRMNFDLPLYVLKQYKEKMDELRNNLLKTMSDTDPLFLYQLQKHKYRSFDNCLDNDELPDVLTQPTCQEIVRKAIDFHHGQKYIAHCFCIMPNHVHLLITPIMLKPYTPASLPGIMHSIKSFTSNEINKHLGKQGAFWMREYYDHVIKTDDALRKVVYYILQNPVKAHLTERWGEWKGNWIEPEFNKIYGFTEDLKR